MVWILLAIGFVFICAVPFIHDRITAWMEAKADKEIEYWQNDKE